MRVSEVYTGYCRSKEVCQLGYSIARNSTDLKDSLSNSGGRCRALSRNSVWVLTTGFVGKAMGQFKAEKANFSPVWEFEN